MNNSYPCLESEQKAAVQSQDPENDGLTNVTVGSIDNSAEVKPSNPIFVDTKLPWYESTNNCRNLEKQNSKQC
jgi:hypothetical protein